MSHNQSRFEKTEGHLKRPGRSGSLGKNKGFSSGGKGGGPPATAPALSSSSALPPPSASLESSNNRSVKKTVNGQGEQTRANPVISNSDAGTRAVPNGAHSVTPSHGIGPLNGLESGSAKPVDSSNKKISRAVPKAPAAQSAVATPGDECGPYLQFGTISPGIMNGMQVPARTCSAPPNLDEQKRDQARHDSVRVAPALPIPSAPKPQQALQQPPPQQPLLQQKQQQILKDSGGFNQVGSRESHPPIYPKRDMHVPIPSIPNASPARSSVLNVGGMPMHVPFQQPQIPLQFSGPNLQISSQGIVPSSLQMPMTLPAGNAPQVPQQLFVPNIQSHSLQPPAIMAQGQSLGYTAQLGHQMPPQLGSIGVGITPQFHQQQPGNFGSQRKAVKITHPETHEELKLDKRTNLQTDAGTTGQRQIPNATSQSQPHPTFNQQISYYPATFNPPPMYYPSSLPLSSTQMTTGPQAARYGYTVGQNGHTISFMNPSPLNSAMGGRPGLPPPLHGLPEAVNSEVSSVSASLAAAAQMIIKPAEKVGTPSVRISMPITKPESPKLSELFGDVPAAPQPKDKEIVSQNTIIMQKKNFEAPVTDSSSSTTDKNLIRVSAVVSGHINKSEASSLARTVGSFTSAVAEKDGWKKEALKSESLKDDQTRLNKKELKHSQQQIDALDDAGNLIMHSAKTVMDKKLTNAVGHSVSNDSVAIHSASAADSFFSVTNSHSTIRESKTSELDEKNDAAGALGPSIATLEEEPSEAVGSNCSDPVELAGDRLSIEEEGHLEASSSSTDVDRLILGTSGVSLGSSKTLVVGQIQENLPESECGKGEISGCDLLGGSAPLSIIDSSDETAGILIPEAENETGLKLCDGDDLQFTSLEKDGGYSVPKRATVSNVLTSTFSDRKDTEVAPFDQASFTPANDTKISATDSTIYKCETCSENVAAGEHVISLLEIASMSLGSEIKDKPGAKTVELSSSTHTLSVLSGLPNKPSLEPTLTKTNKKKKKKEILSKADAAGSSDLYNAYKGPDQKLDTFSTTETIESSSAANSKNNTVEHHTDVDVAIELEEQSKSEIEDWEDAADASTPKLTSDYRGLAHVEKKMLVECGNESTGKRKYSIDFLLTFLEKCKDLPLGFEVGSDIADIFMCVQAGLSRGTDRDILSSPGRVIDRSPGVSRGDRRMVGITDDDRWMKGSGAFRIDLGHGVAAMNVRPGQGVNQGVLRNPRLQSSNQLSGGILSGPMQSLTSQGGIARNNSDADRWQRATGTQRGLMPPPQGSMQVMHKSANRYEVGKVSDEEEQKQRQLKAILNKLTPQNFEKLFAKVKEVNIDNTNTLTGVISQIFDKALMEPTFCEMYADFCFHLAGDLPDFVEDNEKVTFKRLLLNKCQEEFERGEREEAEADKAEEEGEVHHSEAEREEKRIQARRRMLGNIRLIGELYKKKMLTEGIMHGCIHKLLGQYQNPDEENIEALCKLMSTIGEMIDHSRTRERMDAYFEMMAQLSTNQKLSSRVRFMLKDTIDLRKNKWQQRRKVEGPKKIDDVHRDAAQERQAQTTRLARGPIISSKRGLPTDYGYRGSTILNSPTSQPTGSIRGLPGQLRGPGSQDVRLDNRNQFENRVISSVPLPQRPADVGSITLGPQGGLAKGMSGRGQGLVSNAPLSDSHRLASGPNGFSSTHDRIPSTSREESMPKYLTDRSSVLINDQTSSQDRSSGFGIRDPRYVDRVLDRSGGAATGRRPGSSGGRTSASDSKALSEDTLRKKSISTIHEFYSIRDEDEVVLCIRDLSTPSFYPSMVSHWVSDSFERKNMERSLLAQLIVNLSKRHDSLISPSQLVEGFESVLSTLEETVTDVPKAAEFLGYFFGKVVVENLVPLREIGKLIREGGEQPGSLVDAGLGSEILGNILEFVKMEKGDSFLNEIRTSSNLRLDDFRPPYSSAKTKKLDAFL
ncbi:eukaryotic translation initiation factor 4G isoform X1 [Dendrobium catenatum]|uniref:Eukaryotic translation initiation factor 4G n=1 Tax=Dendrobium catenatum TaxID=906689 RepID=A0A2I0W016_9ASPA|nr:eukaryotic translation initiation factor 4G isoform X1 [Dendrobium catenatum]PKU68988.1 Eukaryotic translation initiation factor 4G [Dendrobium catenatum]